MKIEHQKWYILVATGIMLVLVNLDLTIVNMALPDIARSLDVGLNHTQWIIAGYLMATALSFTIFGRLADMLGRKKIFLVGVCLFTLASLVAGFSDSISMLVAARFVQGLGFGAALGLAIVLVLPHFSIEKRGMVTGVVMTIVGASQAIGPTIGGVVVQHFSWPWIFWMNVPLGLICVLMTALIVPADQISEKQYINLKNVALYVIGLGAILYALNEINRLPWLWLTVCFVMGIVLLSIFIHSTFHKGHPLIKVSLLLHQRFRLVVAIRFLFMVLFMATLFVMPLYLQNILGYSPSMAGIIMLSMTFFFLLAAPIVGRVMDRIGYAWPVLISMLLALLGSVLALLLQPAIVLLPILATLFFIGLSTGLHVPSTVFGVNHEVPPADTGTAIGLFFTFAMIGGTIGIALSGALLGGISKAQLIAKLGVDMVNRHLLHVASGARSLHELPIHLRPIAAHAFIYALHDLMLCVAVLMVVAIGLSIYLLKNKR